MADLAGGLSSNIKSLSAERDEVWDLIHPNRASLERLKRVSLRNRTWFTVLTWKQRKLIDIVIRTVTRIRSLLLLKVLAPLVGRLLRAIGGDTRRGALALMSVAAYEMMKTVAQKIIQVAQKWGNKSAHEWLTEGFIRYLIVINLPQNKNPATFPLQ